MNTCPIKRKEMSYTEKTYITISPHKLNQIERGRIPVVSHSSISRHATVADDGENQNRRENT